MFNFIANAYYWCLWVCGYADTDGNLNTPDDREKVTFMLRRQKERNGWVWWVWSMGTQFGLLIAIVLLGVYHRFGYMVIPILLLSVATWLFVHVLWAYIPPDDKFWEGKK